MRLKSSLKLRFTLLLVLVFVIGTALSGVALYRQLQMMGQDWVSSNGLVLLHAMIAMRSYTADHVVPLMNPLMDNGKGFLPEAVPAFTARSVFDNMRGQGLPEKYFYKEAALNPTTPQDLADAWEADLVTRFRSDRNLQQVSGFRTLNGQLTFYSARPMAITSQACLQCHTTPEVAPAAMVARYGAISGFGWKLNDVIAAQIVYAPASEVYQRGVRTWLFVMGITMATFALAVLAINLLLGRNVIGPITQMADLAQEISADQVEESAPDRLDAISTRTDELGQMARVFQRMAREVYAREQGLRQQLQALRIEIDEVKKAKQVAELTGSNSFADLQERARQLRERRRAQTSDTTPEGDTTPS
jgi:HAMP domain-containing protein